MGRKEENRRAFSTGRIFVPNLEGQELAKSVVSRRVAAEEATELSGSSIHGQPRCRAGCVGICRKGYIRWPDTCGRGPPSL